MTPWPVVVDKQHGEIAFADKRAENSNSFCQYITKHTVQTLSCTHTEIAHPRSTLDLAAESGDFRYAQISIKRFDKSAFGNGKTAFDADSFSGFIQHKDTVADLPAVGQHNCIFRYAA